MEKKILGAFFYGMMVVVTFLIISKAQQPDEGTVLTMSLLGALYVFCLLMSCLVLDKRKRIYGVFIILFTLALVAKCFLVLANTLLDGWQEQDMLMVPTCVALLVLLGLFTLFAQSANSAPAEAPQIPNEE